MLKRNRVVLEKKFTTEVIAVDNRTLLQKNKLMLVLSIALAAALIIGSGKFVFAASASTANITLPFSYSFNYPGQLDETGTLDQSSSPYWWVKSGARLVINSSGVASTLTGSLPSSSPWYSTYTKRDNGGTDGGAHPQNRFLMLTRTTGGTADISAEIYINRLTDNLANTANRHSYNGESLLVRYQDDNTYYMGTIRADGYVVIKKKTNGVYQTLASKKILSGTYNANTNPDLIPLNTWIGLKLIATNNSNGVPTLTLYTDVRMTGSWTQAISVTDDPSIFGVAITNAGLVGIQSDFADAQFDNFKVVGTNSTTTSSTTSPTVISTTTSQTPVSAPVTGTTPTPAPTANTTAYDSVVLGDNPVMFLTMSNGGTGTEKDLSGRNHTGTYKGGTPISVTMPNGDTAADFNGTSQYLTVPSSSDLSIATTKYLTWEAWIRPDTLQFAKASSDGYIDWMGKCENYSPSCEWEARMYSTVTSQNRPSRLSAYVFNPGAGLGSAADWQPSSTNIIQAGQWIHVVAEYQVVTTPSGCSTAYPGSINIWVNGVKQNFASHVPTGCMSQYSVTPRSGNSALNIGTMAFDTWFKGAVGKVAVYNRLLTQTEINEHYTAMTGKQVTGSCAATCSF